MNLPIIIIWASPLSIFRGNKSDSNVLFHENPQSKQKSPRLDATCYCVTSPRLGLCRLPCICAINRIYLTAVSGVGLVPTYGTSQVLLVGVPGDFSRGSPILASPTDWSVL